MLAMSAGVEEAGGCGRECDSGRGLDEGSDGDGEGREVVVVVVAVVVVRGRRRCLVEEGGRTAAKEVVGELPTGLVRGRFEVRLRAERRWRALLPRCGCSWGLRATMEQRAEGMELIKRREWEREPSGQAVASFMLLVARRQAPPKAAQPSSAAQRTAAQQRNATLCATALVLT